MGGKDGKKAEKTNQKERGKNIKRKKKIDKE